MRIKKTFPLVVLWVMTSTLLATEPFVERKHRLQMDPIVSFFIQGAEGAYEFKVPGTYLTLDVPFTLGYNNKLYAQEGRIITTGSGFGINKFLNAPSVGSHVNLRAHYKWFDEKRKRYTGEGWEIERERTNWLYFSLMWGYRWHSSKNGFFANLNLGSAYLIAGEGFWVGGHTIDFQGLIPMGQVSLGYALF